MRIGDPGLLLALLSGALIFVALTGGGILDPRNTDWLLREQDGATGFVAWQFYRDAPLAQFPFGANPTYGLEMSSSVVFTDSIPLLAFAFKPFSAFLPAAFQYFGLWLFLSFSLQSSFAYLLLMRFVGNRPVALLGSLFFGIAPICVARLAGHFTLVGQWLVLAPIYLYFAPRWSPRAWASALLACVLVHFYFLAMALPIWMADLWQRRWREQVTRRSLAIHVSAVAVTLACALWASGYFMVGGSFGEPGFGKLRMNVFALFDPDDMWSFVLPDLPGSEWEGFNYLGAGLLALAVPAGYACIRRRPFTLERRIAVPLLVVCIGLTIFAVSDHVAAGAAELFTYDVPEILHPFIDLLRSSGRMFWPVYYLIILGILVAVSRAFSPRVALIGCMAALAAQVADTWVGLRWFEHRFIDGSPVASPMRSPLWAQLGKRYGRVVHVLPRNAPDTFLPLALFARQHHMAINFGYFARVDALRLGLARSVLEVTVSRNRLDPGSLYVFENPLLWQAVKEHKRPRDVLGVLDGWRILAPGLLDCHDCDLQALDDVRPDLPGLYSLGERVAFAKGGEGPRGGRYAIEGWSAPEDWGMWSTGPKAQLLLPLAEAPRHDVILTLYGQAFVNRRHEQQQVDVMVNGVAQQSLLYNRRRKNDIRSIRIPAAAVQGGQVLVELRFPDAASPRELGLSDDDRKLGLGLIALRLREQ